MSNDVTLIQFFQRFPGDKECRQYLESILWKDGRVCRHCGTIDNSILLKGKSTRPGVYKCRDCRKQFTVTVGTIFEDSHLPLQKWFAAIYMMCSSRKGVSANQLHRQLGMTYKSAWFLCHRIRKIFAGKDFPHSPLLRGVVEADETFVGGKQRHKSRRKVAPKTPVLVAVERGGNARSAVVNGTGINDLKDHIYANVSNTSIFMTDENPSYRQIGEKISCHHTVNHSSGEYAYWDVNSNTAESYFALLKRGIYGIYHYVSRKHLHRYCAEYDFRWNHRGEPNINAVSAMLGKVEGSRLTYQALKQ